MSGRDEWVEKQLAREAKAKVQAKALVSEETVRDLACRLAVKGAAEADLAQRLLLAGHDGPFYSRQLYSGAAFNVAAELLHSYFEGRPIMLKARLERARQSLETSDFDRRQDKEHEKLLSKPAKKKKKAA
jgi:hypothetical protein